MLIKILLVILLIGLAFASLAIRVILKKDGKFSKSCSHADPSTGEKTQCVCSGSDPLACRNRDKGEKQGG